MRHANDTKPRRERPKAVQLTDAAAARIREIMAGADGHYQGVRVGVTNGGCAGMSYTMDYAESAKPLEEVVEDKGVQDFHRSQGDPVPDRHRNGFRAREAGRAFRLQQSEPDGGLRLRRIRVDHARQGGLNARRGEALSPGPVRNISARSVCAPHVRRRRACSPAM